MAKSISSLIRKFSDPKYGKLGVGSLDKDTQKLMAVMLENQTNFRSDLLAENDGESQASDGNVDYEFTDAERFKPIALAMVRRAVPAMWTTKWVPSQGLQTPVGLAYALRFYDDATQNELWEPGNRDLFMPYAGGAKKTLTELVMLSAGDKAALGITTTHADAYVILSEAKTMNITLNSDGNFVCSFVCADSTGAHFADPLDPAVSATVTVTIPFSIVQGAKTTEAEDWFVAGQNFAPTGANAIRQIGLKLDTVPVYARTKKLAASFSLENAADLQRMNGLDLHREMVDTLHAEVASEIDRECLWRMKRTAVLGTGGRGAIISITIPAPAGLPTTTFGRYSAEIIDTLVKTIVYQANDIYRTTRRAIGNFVICSPGIASALQFAPGFTQAEGYKADVNVSRQLEIGKLSNGITVYMDADSRNAKEWALVGLKGAGDRDGGIIFSPYMMGVQSEAVSPADFSPRIGVMSRYAFTDNLLGAGRYYRYVEFTGFENVGISW